MIPRLRAVAIDDDKDHLDIIQKAALRAGIGCVPLRYPDHATSDHLDGIGLKDFYIRVIITDLNLNAISETGDGRANYATIASLIAMMGLPSDSPYVLVLWTRDPTQLERLRGYLEETLPAAMLPGLLISLDKNEYGILDKGDTPNHEKLWQDLLNRIQESRGLNLLLEWESELIRAADHVVRKLVNIARPDKPGKINIDDELDRILSLIAQQATSNRFAGEHPRDAANEGLLPLVIDEMQHLHISAERNKRWLDALAKAVAMKDDRTGLSPTVEQCAVLNDALHIARDRYSTGSDRGSVFHCWHGAIDVMEIFGISRPQFPEVFGILEANWPPATTLKYVQFEGLCDSTQKKDGLIPFMLACEVPAETKVSSNRPRSILESPTYTGTFGSARKLIINVRYFFSLDRPTASTRIPEFRIRESLMTKWATDWATHSVRPGTIEFRAK